MHKKQSFPLRISSVNVTKTSGFLQIWSHMLKKFLTENFIFCTGFGPWKRCSEDFRKIHWKTTGTGTHKYLCIFQLPRSMIVVRDFCY